MLAPLAALGVPAPHAPAALTSGARSAAPAECGAAPAECPASCASLYRYVPYGSNFGDVAGIELVQMAAGRKSMCEEVSPDRPYLSGLGSTLMHQLGIGAHLTIRLLQDGLERGGDQRGELTNAQPLVLVVLRVGHLGKPQEQPLVNVLQVVGKQLWQLVGCLRRDAPDAGASHAKKREARRESRRKQCSRGEALLAEYVPSHGALR